MTQQIYKPSKIQKFEVESVKSRSASHNDSEATFRDKSEDL